MHKNLVIKDFHVTEVQQPLKRPFVTHLHTVTAIRALRVAVELDNGLVGIGTATPNEQVTGDTLATLREVMTNVIGPQLVGQSLNRFEPLMERLQGMIKDNMPAKAAFDIALYDLRRQLYGVSLTELLGGAKDSMATDYTISISSPDQMVAEARQLVKDGFSALKIKIGNQPVQTDVATVVQIAEAVGPQISLRLDVNQGWSYKQALLGCHLLEQAHLNIAFIEQPLPAGELRALATLRTQTWLPIMVDESVFLPADALAVINYRAADYVNIKLMKSGGLYYATQINQLCAAAGIPCMVGCMIEAQESIGAAVAFANAHTNVHFVDLDSLLMMKSDFQGCLKYAGPQIWLG